MVEARAVLLNVTNNDHFIIQAVSEESIIGNIEIVEYAVTVVAVDRTSLFDGVDVLK